MDTFPYHALTRPYTLGTPRWRPTENGVMASRLGSGVMRTRDALGQAIWAIDLRLDGLTAADISVLWAFVDSNRAAQFYWVDPLIGPLSDSAYTSWICRFAPESPPVIEQMECHDLFSAQITLLPAIPTTSAGTLMAWWLMDEGGAVLSVGGDDVLEVGTDEVLSLGGAYEVPDATGNGNAGTSSQTVDTMSGDGHILGALSFNGTTDYVAVADSEALRLASGGAIGAWIYPDTMGESDEGRILDKSSGVDAAAGYAFALASSGRIAFRVAGDAEWTLSSASAITVATWQHVAVSFSASGRKLYVNGVDVTASGGSLTRLPPVSTAAIRVGNRAGATDRSYDGLMEDLRVYQRPLSRGEWLAIYNGGAGTSEVVVP